MYTLSEAERDCKERQLNYAWGLEIYGQYSNNIRRSITIY